jgi:predicted DNA-binding ArsR family transcriptional regulator
MLKYSVKRILQGIIMVEDITVDTVEDLVEELTLLLQDLKDVLSEITKQLCNKKMSLK